MKTTTQAMEMLRRKYQRVGCESNICAILASMVASTSREISMSDRLDSNDTIYRYSCLPIINPDRVVGNNVSTTQGSLVSIDIIAS
jgi:hypothetical protein